MLADLLASSSILTIALLMAIPALVAPLETEFIGSQGRAELGVMLNRHAG